MSRLKVYVASSWRNERYPEVVRRLKESKLVEVYDFRNPEDKPGGFSWNEHAPDWREWSAERLRYELQQEPGRTHFARDMAALEQADVCVLVAPAGRSAHLEAGFARGAWKFLLILAVDEEPELMYGMGRIVTSVEELLNDLKILASRFSWVHQDAERRRGYEGDEADAVDEEAAEKEGAADAVREGGEEGAVG